VSGILGWLVVPGLLVLTAACGGPASSPAPSPSSELQIVGASAGPLHALAGDAIVLKVVVVAPDGSTTDLAADAGVEWQSPSSVTALAPGSTAPSPMPVAGTPPTAAWIVNPFRPDGAANLSNALFVLDPGTVQNGTVQVSATVTGTPAAGEVTAPLVVDPTPAGDWSRGAVLYGPSGANCALCHGGTGHGSAVSDTGQSVIDGSTYDFPAPGINAEPGNTASDPAWNAALFAVACRADVNKDGIALRAPMPDWLTAPNPVTGLPLSTQDLADIYAFLKTQTQ
jgi:hypothetical protein